uniref:Glutathione peroxidase n=1 Tax=Daucus carota subsp. sativus TaxID=79200 RepID=A0A166HCU8_DAUCS
MNSSWANSNYSELTELYDRYKDTDFEILAFPCNQFLKQAPGTGEQLQNYACEKFQAEYPVFQKVSCTELKKLVTRVIKKLITNVVTEFSKHLRLKDYKENVTLEVFKVAAPNLYTPDWMVK